MTACVYELSFSAFAGAALSMIPVAGAIDAVKSGELSEMIHHNLHEIMNICSRLFISPKTPHLRLEKVYIDPGALPGNARAMGDAAGGRSDFNVSIPGYGEGHISFLST